MKGATGTECSNEKEGEMCLQEQWETGSRRRKMKTQRDSQMA